MINNLELYIHIPFCVKKCNYCDFISFANCEDQIDDYISALTREIEAYSAEYADTAIASVFIGGGTPSIIPVKPMDKLLNSLYKNFKITGTMEKRRGLYLQKKVRPVTEFTIECNPGTLDKEKLKFYRKNGINRLSLGLQATDNEDLKVLGRIHTFEDFMRNYNDARMIGFDNINVDLMQAIPGQSLKSWERSLTQIALLSPEHISAYSLIIEEGTPFYEMNKKEILLLPSEEEERAIYYFTRDFLYSVGYNRYEISNYAKPGYECVHNAGYWRRRNYLGLGLNSSSMVDNRRWKNTSDLKKYLGYTDFKALKEEVQTLSHKEQMEEFMFLGLRLMNGISKEVFMKEFHQDYDFTYGDVTEKLKEEGFLMDEKGQVYLTDKGIDVSNRVLSEFLFDKE